MTALSNLHTHTTYCDGKNTVEELILRAVELGWESIGFSGHAFTPCDTAYCMSREGTVSYQREILSLREKYNGTIQIYLGIEQDLFSDPAEFPYDYIIGSTHYLRCADGTYGAVDDSPEVTAALVDRYFGGDYYRYAQAYYRQIKEVATVTKCDIVGHFDLITKFNEGNRFFDTLDSRYRAAALEALEQVAKTCPLFEINTGAMLRAGRSVPYPEAFLLRHLHHLGGEVILTSDCHRVEGLDWAFDQAADLAKECGFRYGKILRDGMFVDIVL